jgi:hypothetical protein
MEHTCWAFAAGMGSNMNGRIFFLSYEIYIEVSIGYLGYHLPLKWSAWFLC